VFLDKKVYMDVFVLQMMKNADLVKIEKDYNRIKKYFWDFDAKTASSIVLKDIDADREYIEKIFDFLIIAFKGKIRKDGKTPLCFHSIYLTKLLNYCGEREIDNLLVPALHDVLEDTDVDEKELMKQSFMKGKGHVIEWLKILKENVLLSREPNGKNLPPRYKEHIKRLVGAPREVVNTEILDRFCDLMDLEYITNLSEEERDMRIASKLIKVKSFVRNITRNRDNFSKNCLDLFNYKLKKTEKIWGMSPKEEIIS